MLKLGESYEVDRSLINCEHFAQSFPSLIEKNTHIF